MTLPSRRVHGPDVLERAISLEAELDADPSNDALLTRLGHAWLALDDVDQALASFEQARELNPGSAEALNGLASALREQGRVEEAISLWRRAIELQPSYHKAIQNLLFHLLCVDGVSEQEIFNAHRSFADRFARPSALPTELHGRKRLRIGYISPDFREHVVGYCMLPVFQRHAREEFEVFSYFSGKAPDRLTAQIKASSEHWRDVARLPDAALVKTLRSDALDILVDLSGHTPGNRLAALAHKAAPVQITYLDYSATTGLDCFDYRITDAVCDPVGVADGFYTEKLLRQPGTYLLYNPPENPAPPIHFSEKLVLACMSAFYKVSARALECWAGILRELPQAELILVGVPRGDTERRVIQQLESMGVGADRVHLLGLLAYADYLSLTSRIDIALAPFPYNGAMTTLDCLWNGVPVVCRQGGRTFHSRMGQSILGAVGLEELVAPDLDAYKQKAIQLALDPVRRASLRGSLRDRIKRSPLQDFEGFTRALEQHYAAARSAGTPPTASRAGG